MTKQIWLVSIILASTATLSPAQTRFTIRAGINLSNVTDKAPNGTKADTQSIPGLSVGLAADVPLPANFFFQPALFYARKGFKQESDGFGSATNLRVKADYLQLPLDLVYKPKIGPGRLLLGAGPYIAYGLGGSWKSDGNLLIGDISEPGRGTVAFRNNAMVRNESEYIYGRPLDFGFNALLGYEIMDRFSIQFLGQLGVANLVPRFDDYQPGGSLRNKSFGVSLGYKL